MIVHVGRPRYATYAEDADNAYELMAQSEVALDVKQQGTFPVVPVGISCEGPAQFVD